MKKLNAAEPAGGETRETLHAAIMNLECVVPKDANINQALSFKYGHRQARHAAAELALATPPQAPAVPAGLSDGERWIKVNATFDALVMAMDRASRKGYMPHSLDDEWDAFDWAEAQD